MSGEIRKIAFKYWAVIGSQEELENWAQQELLKNRQPHPDVYDLFNLTYEEAKKVALRLARDLHDFSPTSEQGEDWARELLHLYGQKLLDEKINVLTFCQLVQKFDNAFLDARPTDDDTVYYPEWLGNLWNWCDWCDETWTLESSPELVEEVRRILANEA